MRQIKIDSRRVARSPIEWCTSLDQISLSLPQRAVLPKEESTVPLSFCNCPYFIIIKSLSHFPPNPRPIIEDIIDVVSIRYANQTRTPTGRQAFSGRQSIWLHRHWLARASHINHRPLKWWKPFPSMRNWNRSVFCDCCSSSPQISTNLPLAEGGHKYWTI